MSHTSPLAFAFLLQQAPYRSMRHIIVEDETMRDGLSEHLAALWEYWLTDRHCMAIKDATSATRIHLDQTSMGIWSADMVVDPPTLITDFSYMLRSGAHLQESDLITWLDDHGYAVQQHLVVGSYIRQGDVIRIMTDMAEIRVSFFGNTVDQIWVDEEDVDQVILWGHQN